MAKYKSPLRYAGGKSRVAGHLVSLFPKDCEHYIEPMVGGGSVYFEAKSQNLFKTYWINDKFRELINFYRVIQDPEKCSEMIINLKGIFYAAETVEYRKDLFKSYKEQLDAPHMEYVNALRFFYINRCSFSGTTLAGGFSKSAAMERFTLSSIERLRKMTEALRDTGISCRNYYECFPLKEGSCFYFLDPPYMIPQKLYGKNGDLHTSFNHYEFSDWVKGLTAKFMITYNDCEEIRELYKDFHIQPLEFSYGMSKNKKGKEIIITNYDC